MIDSNCVYIRSIMNFIEFYSAKTFYGSIKWYNNGKIWQYLLKQTYVLSLNNFTPIHIYTCVYVTKMHIHICFQNTSIGMIITIMVHIHISQRLRATHKSLPSSMSRITEKLILIASEVERCGV